LGRGTALPFSIGGNTGKKDKEEVNSLFFHSEGGRDRNGIGIFHWEKKEQVVFNASSSMGGGEEAPSSSLGAGSGSLNGVIRRNLY